VEINLFLMFRVSGAQNYKVFPVIDLKQISIQKRRVKKYQQQINLERVNREFGNSSLYILFISSVFYFPKYCFISYGILKMSQLK
uniref:hypothetical protein n=1 Tax=Salmonella sp. s51944 TaxID=3159655 RepID=UPI00397EB688